MLRPTIAVAALTASLSASAFFISGNELYNNMKSREYIDKMYALGYVAAVYDSNSGDLFCPPSGVSVGQAQDIVEKFMRDTPSIRNENAAYIAIAALQTVWPCRKGKSS